jgi:putative zinc finger/helix-turn-helix YgiT family protein
MEKEKICPNDSVIMNSSLVNKAINFKGEEIQVQYQAFVCGACGLESVTTEVAHEVQCYVSDCYREKHELLPGKKIKELREKQGVTQAQLAAEINVGIASIKRWENGLVQNKAMDELLKHFLEKEDCCIDPFYGNRTFSMSRIKLVLDEFQKVLGKELLKPNDRLLYSAKYLWYADMVAYRDLGKSMTGATYAALPQGPQLNNYSDLVPQIIEADTAATEPLSEAEREIITVLSKLFPKGTDAYHSSHKEPAWLSTNVGAPISYTKARTLLFA